MRKILIFPFLFLAVLAQSQIAMTKVFVGRDSFAISNTEITQGQFELMMGYNPSKFKCKDCPVESLSLLEAANFAIILSAREKATFALPSESEWEAVAAAGANIKPDSIGDYVWFKQNSFDQTHPVGKRKPINQLYDLFGNVWEMTRTGDQNSVVLKGGSWASVLDTLGPKRRTLFDPSSRSDNVGFRVVRIYPK